RDHEATRLDAGHQVEGARAVVPHDRVDHVAEPGRVGEQRREVLEDDARLREVGYVGDERGNPLGDRGTAVPLDDHRRQRRRLPPDERLPPDRLPPGRFAAAAFATDGLTPTRGGALAEGVPASASIRDWRSSSSSICRSSSTSLSTALTLA